MRSRALFAAVFLLAPACAQMGGPPGGPVDDVPPEIVFTRPASGSTGVALPRRLAVAFSEKVAKRTVERSLRVFPPPGWIDTSWEGETLFVETDRLTEGGGITRITLSGVLEDRRGNRMGTPRTITFTTGPSLPEGRVSGDLEGIQKGKGMPPVTIRVLEASGGDSTVALAETEAAEEGTFLVDHLPVGPLTLLAFQDEDESGTVDYEYEYYALSDTIVLSSEKPAADSIHLRLVSADTPAALAGRLLPPLPLDSVVVLLRAEADTVEPRVAEPDSTGSYSFSRVSPGVYAVQVVPGGMPEPAGDLFERAARPLAERAVTLRPGEEVADFDLPAPPLEPQVTQ